MNDEAIKTAYGGILEALGVEADVLGSSRKSPAVAALRAQAAWCLRRYDLTHQQVADIIGIQVSTVSKGLIRLEKCLADDDTLKRRLVRISNAAKRETEAAV